MSVDNYRHSPNSCFGDRLYRFMLVLACSNWFVGYMPIIISMSMLDPGLAHCI